MSLDAKEILMKALDGNGGETLIYIYSRVGSPLFPET